jgi:glyoxylase-like metal-dependent hydrolase (beta-lactamase superfamily II)
MIEEKLPGLWRVGGHGWGVTTTLSGSRDSNVYLLRLNDAEVLIDCGTLEGRPFIENNIREAGVNPENITDLLLTHSHYDHTQGVVEWQSRYRLRTHLNAIGVQFLERGDYRLVGYEVEGPDFTFQPFRVDHAIQNGETFAVGSTLITAHFLPGHTPDSTLLTFDFQGYHIGLSGDITFGPSPQGTTIGWMQELWLSDAAAYQKSLQRLLEIPIDILLPGHGHAIVGRDAVREAVSASLHSVEQMLGE